LEIGYLPKKTPRRFAAPAFAIGLALLAISIARGEWSAGRAPLPFVWRDIALVYLASAIPLAWLIGGWVYRNSPAFQSLLVSVLFMAIPVAPSFTDLASVPSAVLRGAIALCVALSAVLVARLLIADRELPAPSTGSWMMIFGLITFGAVPPIYVHAHCRHDLDRLGEYLDQGRIGEASRLAQAVLKLDAHAELRGQPLGKLTAAIEREVIKLETLVAAEVPEDAAAHARLQRAQHLAMLGRTDAAVAALDKLSDATLAADADNLRGTIYESRGEWASALAAYLRAKDACASLPPSANLVRATTGVAYAQRKSGDYVGAAKSYQELLALTPNAETHFLLAQFYEDAQDADRASRHARRAMILNPGRYQKDGERLIRKLSVFQFGCLRAIGE